MKQKCFKMRGDPGSVLNRVGLALSAIPKLHMVGSRGKGWGRLILAHPEKLLLTLKIKQNPSTMLG